MQFDLKFAEVFVKDGTNYIGAVNLLAGYLAGLSTMVIDGVVGVVPVGTPFIITGDPTEYAVTAHTETSLNTTSITFTPPLGMPVTDDQVITFGPNFLKCVIGEGNVTFSEKRVIQYMKDRGLLGTVRLGDQDPVDVKLDLRWEFLSSMPGAAVPTIEEALKNIGPASGWISSSPDLCEPYCVDLEIHYSPACTTEQRELIVLPMYRYESLDHDLKAGTVNSAGKCNVIECTASRVTAFAQP